MVATLMRDQQVPACLKGIQLPPNGWTLAILLALYIFSGLIGHDPWKNDDAVTIGVVNEMVNNGDWLRSSLAGRPFPDAPLYYWLATVSSHLLSWLLPVHEATRLASSVFTLLALTFILLAARELHGREPAPAAPLLLAGSVGFLFHAHEAQPMLAALAAHTAAYWGLVQIDRRPRRGACYFGAALGLGYLANGLAPMLPLLPVAAFVVWRAKNRQHTALLSLGALLLAGAIASLWLLPLLLTSPGYLSDLWLAELNQLSSSPQPLLSMQRLLLMLPWYAWPALPLAGWTLWAKRRQLSGTPMLLPIFSFVLTLLVVSLCLGARSASTLLLLPPLVLLAAPGIQSLRRGAANAFDWFGMITFSVFSLLIWLGWMAMVFGWPARLAKQLTRMEPGFVGQPAIAATVAALLATLAWCWLIATTPRSPMRGIMHWMAGVTLFWLLMTLLWMPWFDYGKTYRAVATSLVKALPEKRDCIAGMNLTDAMLASLSYFQGLQIVPARSAPDRNCDLLLIHGTPKEAGLTTTSGWRKIWEGGRPVDRRDNEKLRLYQRSAKKNVSGGARD